MHARKKMVERAKIPRKKGKLHGRKMAEIQPVDDDAKARKRKPKFSVSEFSAIIENVQKNQSVQEVKASV